MASKFTTKEQKLEAENINDLIAKLESLRDDNYFDGAEKLYLLVFGVYAS